MYDLLSLPSLALLLLQAKEKEDKAKKLRISCEEEIARLIETKEQGQKTVELENGFKITVKRGLIFKADPQSIREVFADSDFFPPIITKIEEKLDEKGYEWYREHHPDVFSELSEFVTVTPQKTAVTVKVPNGRCL